jgi:uncharacterized protein (TIGR02597 family)
MKQTVSSLLAPGLLVAVLGISLTGGLTGATVYSPVVGFLKFDCPADSDTVVSVPFHPTPRWAGRLSAAPSNPVGNVFRIALKDSPSFAAGELTTTPHFLFCRDATGPEGRHFLITNHASDSVDISASAPELSGLTTDSQVSVIPAWTLDTLFPAATQTTLHPSTGPLATQRVSELLFFDQSTAGTSLAPNRRFYVTSGGWFEVGSFAAAGSTVIAPGQPFLIRHPAGVAATTFVPNQQVYGGKVTLAIPVANGKARDTMVSLPRPVALTLAQLDFAPGDFIESPSTDPGDREDQLLVYDNSQIERNKLPAATYYRSGGQWLRSGTNAVSDSVTIEPSAGLLLRKAAGGADLVVLWKNAPTYDVTAP